MSEYQGLGGGALSSLMTDEETSEGETYASGQVLGARCVVEDEEQQPGRETKDRRVEEVGYLLDWRRIEERWVVEARRCL